MTHLKIDHDGDHFPCLVAFDGYYGNRIVCSVFDVLVRNYFIHGLPDHPIRILEYIVNVAG
ncbi:MAG: hypothetical protein OXC14_07855 [Rhodospirillaceae bacterium]|nr:hypothetical protein [Rhodospirillaceae bacterium]